MTEHFKLSDYVGAKVMNEAKKTRLWALSCALDAVCYDLATVSDPARVQFASTESPKCVVDAKKYVGSEAGWGQHKFDWLTASGFGAGYYASVPKLLRHIQQELERLALLEVTR